MAYAVTQSCCNDASCVSVCPVNCIHPTPDERAATGLLDVEMVYIDPASCIDCGACADACPVSAIVPTDLLRGPDTIFADLNRAYYEQNPTSATWDSLSFPTTVPQGYGELRVAIVGTGPSAAYAARSLLHTTPARITMIDRLPVAGGLLRSGVAPDHPATKGVDSMFGWTYDHPRVSTMLNVEVGRDVTHAELAAHHDAVLYAVGAAQDRPLGIEGEELPGSVSASALVAWYNAQPDREHPAIDLSAERAVVVGNGNVALDVARVLLTDPDGLARTDVADHALAALRRSRVREVVVMARRGPDDAAYSRGELIGLCSTPGLEVVVEDDPVTAAAIDGAADGSKAALLRDLPRVVLDAAGPAGGSAGGPPGGSVHGSAGRRVVLSFFRAPERIEGPDRVTALATRPTGAAASQAAGAAAGHGAPLRTGLVVRAIGYRGTPIPDLPFDESSGTVPNDAGRVLGPDGGPQPGTYVVGWIKRGPTGGIGANRTCAEETVKALVEDASAGRLVPPVGSVGAFASLVRRRTDVVGRRRMQAIDRAERARGSEQGRPRRKFPTVAELLGAAPARTGPRKRAS
ncbi:ferredoxin--NADP+ reductase [Mumia flava]|uniref:ferredoxin--NADP(+) reductase n=1 Tax=Mumia flava TaxID=1348852 RepID=A0A0B2BQH9_9ACTN|nr:FAD-dependent oxidoreductase [Mumia flava]PJJ58198.1 ferredoxin--NADP+ reductase [Mumia flava]